MIEQSLVTLLLIGTIIFVSYKGFNNTLLVERYCFDVDKILIGKEYIRLVSSGFFHTSWMHLIFNMLGLYAFGSLLEPLLGMLPFLLVYFLSLVGGNLLALFIHKNSGDYTSVGASGAVNGIIYAGIALFPSMGIGFFFIPISIPAWAFGLAYIIFSIYGVKAKWGNSGHAAHLGGALIGMLIAIILHPQVLSVNYLPILAILVPTLSFLFLIIYKPDFLLVDTFAKKKKHYSMDHQYNFQKAQEQANIDRILEKIHRKGIGSLSDKEKKTLHHYSKTRQ